MAGADGSVALVQMILGGGKPLAMQSTLAEEPRTTLESDGSMDHLGATGGGGGRGLAVSWRPVWIGVQMEPASGQWCAGNCAIIGPESGPIRGRRREAGGYLGPLRSFLKY